MKGLRYLKWKKGGSGLSAIFSKTRKNSNEAQP
jgi:hypothetical protein